MAASQESWSWEAFVAEAEAKKAREEAERAQDAERFRRARAEGRLTVVPPLDPSAPVAPRKVASANGAFVKDDVYWKRLDQLQSEGVALDVAHPMAMAKSRATAELRAAGIEPRNATPGASLVPRGRPAAGNDNEKPASLPVVSAASLAGRPVPPREFFVPDFVPKGKVTLLSGDGGTGKSLLGLMLGASSALGETWLNMPVQEGSVLVLSAEDDLDEVHRRLAAIVGDDRLCQLDRLHIAPLVGLNPILGAPDRTTGRMAETELFQDLKRKLRKLEPGLLILDTLADLFGGDEVKRDQARGFVAMLNRLTAEFGTTIVLLSHPSQSGMESGRGTSGSTGWSNSVRSRMYLQHTNPESDTRVLTLMKTNSNRPGLKVHMVWQDGYFERVDERQQQADDLGEAKQEFLRLLEEFGRQGRPPSPNVSSTYAPKLFSEEPGVRISKQKLKDAMNALLREDKIEIVETGTPARIRYHLAVVAAATADALRST